MIFSLNAYPLIISGKQTIKVDKTIREPFTVINNEARELFIDLSTTMPSENGIVSPASIFLKPNEKRTIWLEISNRGKIPGEEEIISIIARTQYNSNAKKIKIEFAEQQSIDSNNSVAIDSKIDSNNEAIYPYQGLISFITYEVNQLQSIDLLVIMTIIVLTIFFLRQVLK